MAARGATSGTACLGVSSQEFITYQFPVDITIDTQFAMNSPGSSL